MATGHDGSINIDTRIETGNVNKDLQQMKNEVKQMQNAFKMAEMQAMQPFRKEMFEVQKGFYGLAGSMGAYEGSNRQFMGSVEALGAQQKKVQDAMINGNKMMAVSMMMTAGQMLNMSTQASKISANYDRMRNPLLLVNKGGLAVADSLNKVALAGNASVLALKMLGPNAKMKELVDMQNMITQGHMRFQMVALASLATGILVYGGLHKAAMKSNKEYANSFKEMVANLKKAFQPMVDVFAMVMTKVWNFINAIAEMAIKFNEAHPVLAKLIQGTMMLVPALTLLLSPLAIGIGLVNGFMAAWASVWPMIAPLVTGLAAMSATVWLVAGAIVGLVAGFVYMYNKFDWFKNAVDGALKAIWGYFQKTFKAIGDFIKPAINAVVAFVMEKWNGLKVFWKQNGEQILKIAGSIFKAIGLVIKTQIDAWISFFKLLATVLVPIIKVAWETIKLVINNALNLISSIIKVALALLRGDWEGAWKAIVQFFQNMMNNAIKFLKGIKLYDVGKQIVQGLINGLASMGPALAKKIKGMADGIKDTIKSALRIKSPSRWMKDEVGKMVPAGIALGIDANTSLVDKAMMGISKGMMNIAPNIMQPSQGQQMAGFMDKLGNMNRNVTIENVLHLDGEVVARVTKPYTDTLQFNDNNLTARAMGVR